VTTNPNPTNDPDFREPSSPYRKRGTAHAHETGATHKAYGWGCKPWGDWSDEEIAAHRRGYNGEPL